MTLHNFVTCYTANHRGVRDPRGAAGGGAGGDAGQAQHVVPRVRRQAAGGRRAQPALHDHGGARERARAAGKPVSTDLTLLYMHMH